MKKHFYLFLFLAALFGVPGLRAQVVQVCGGVYYTSEKNITGDWLKSGKISYNAVAGVLTLDNAMVSYNVMNHIRFLAHNVEGLRIVLVGESVIAAEPSGDEKRMTTALNLADDTVIEGSGSLTVYNIEEACLCVTAPQKKLRITGGAAVYARGKYGVVGRDGTHGETVQIESSTVVAEGWKTSFGDWWILETDCLIAEPEGAVFDEYEHGVAVDGEVVKSRVMIVPDAAAYDVRLAVSPAEQRDAVSAVLAAALGVGLSEAQALAAAAPCVALSGAKREKAVAVTKALLALDGVVAFPVKSDAPAGVGRTAAERDGVSVEAVYSPDGRRLSRPAPGMNILRLSDGSTRKALHR